MSGTITASGLITASGGIKLSAGGFNQIQMGVIPAGGRVSGDRRGLIVFQ